MNEPIAQALAGVMLLCAFAMLALNHPRTLIALCRAQSLALTAAAGWQGHFQHATGLYIAALITLVLNVLLLPRLLPATPAQPRRHKLVAPALGIILLAFAISVTPASSVNLGIPLAILLLGLLLIATRRDIFTQTIGLLTTGNGVLLAVIFLPSLPYVPAAAVAVAALAALPILFLAQSSLPEPG